MIMAAPPQCGQAVVFEYLRLQAPTRIRGGEWLERGKTGSSLS